MNRIFPALRGIAILLVVLNHTIEMGAAYPRSQGLITSTWEQIILFVLSGLGLIAVPIFLFLSGSFFSYAARQDDLRSNYQIVWVNLKNVLIPYVIWSLAFYLLVSLVHDQTCTPVECAKQLIVGYPYNFIPLLIFYYIVSPILILAIRKWGWIPVMLIGLFQLLLLNILHPGMLGFGFPDWANRLAPPVIATSLADWAIYFPLGLIYARYAPSYLPAARKYKWVLTALFLVFYLIGLLDIMAVVQLPISRYLFPFFFILLAPIIERGSIPYVKTIESIGKRAYGLYFMNLIVLDLLVVFLTATVPGIFNYYILVLVPLFFLALLIPLGIMRMVERIKHPPIYRYVFG
jgi:peptidoglycan/LPS O-acetylase OafA/YrhL